MKAIFTLIMMATSWIVSAQNIHELQYRAYLNQEQSLDLWKQAVTESEAALKKNPTNDSLQYTLAFSRFSLLSATMRTKDEDTFDKHYNNTITLLEDIIAKNKKWAEPHALLSAAYGLKMAYSPMQGMVLGSKSSSLAEKAIKLNAQSALAWKVYANSKFFTPEMFGGDVAEAIKAFQKSIQLYENQKQTNQWMYLDALAYLGQAYIKTEKKTEAIATFEKALKVEPAFGWVKHGLLPKAKALK